MSLKLKYHLKKENILFPQLPAGKKVTKQKKDPFWGITTNFWFKKVILIFLWLQFYNFLHFFLTKSAGGADQVTIGPTADQITHPTTRPSFVPFQFD